VSQDDWVTAQPLSLLVVTAERGKSPVKSAISGTHVLREVTSIAGQDAQNLGEKL